MRLKIKHVDVSRDPNGRTRYYFRRGHGPRVLLPGEPGTPEFMAAYHRAARGEPVAPPADDGKRRTWDALVKRYFVSTEYLDLAPSSRVAYRRAIERIVRDDKIGPRLVPEMRREHVKAMVDKRAASPSAALDCLKKIRLLLSFAVEIGWRQANPALGIRTPKIGTYHTWTEEEITQFEARWPIGTKERLAFALLLYTGQRGSDVRQMTAGDLIAGRRIRVVQQKTGTPLVVALHPRLREILAASEIGTRTIVETAFGRAYSEKGFGQWLADKFDAAKLPDRCVAHGLRKAAARRLAEAGCSGKQIAAITGHKTLREIERYTEAASQELLADEAIDRVVAFPARPKSQVA